MKKKIRTPIHEDIEFVEEEEIEFEIVEDTTHKSSDIIQDKSIDTSNEANINFDTLIEERMKKFNYLLNHSGFSFKQHQFDGVKWCIQNELRPNPLQNVRGGFIADEMGLGKTLLMIGTMFVNMLPRTLIVVPPVLLEQWSKEIYNASGHTALKFYGKTKKTMTKSTLENARIVLTTYNGLFTRGSEKCLLHQLKWNRVIFDEAHHLRNSSIKAYTASKKLDAKIKWLISGTPIQNNKKDFYNLCEMLGITKAFYKKDENVRLIGQHFLLRRTKAEIGIEMPELIEETKTIPWANEDELNFAEEIHSLLPNITNVSSEKRKQLAENLKKGGSLVGILRAKQCCVMLSLMASKIKTLVKNGVVSSDYLDVLKHSSKIDAVVSLLLERRTNGNGKIVFCHFREEIDTIERRLASGGYKNIVKYDGRNSGGEALKNLGEKADVLILQIQTGCEGLNLQENYNEIYFVSPHWNPSVEDQAIARCHRIGQKKSVYIFKFIMENFKKEEGRVIQPISMDTYINSVQEKKREISREILGQTNKNQKKEVKKLKKLLDLDESQ